MNKYSKCKPLMVRYRATSGASVPSTTRRVWISNLGAAALVAVGSSIQAAPAVATPPVGEGGMPEGARSFSSVIRAQSDWDKIGKRIQQGGLSDEEWKNVALYIRKLYSVGANDMSSMVKGLSKDKQSDAAKLVESFKESVKGSDGPISAHDSEATIAVYLKTSAQLRAFMELFQDVPDEL